MNHSEQIKHNFEPRRNQVIAINDTVENLLSNGFHGLLLEMSLGKTKSIIDACKVLHKYEKLNRTIIICPKAITNVWRDEIPLHSPWTNILEWDNKKTDRYKRQLKSLIENRFPVLIIRLETFQSKNDTLKNFLSEYCIEPTICILDESNKIKNVMTNRTPRLIEYTKNCLYKVILTGSEITESPLDIFAQFEFLSPGFWYSSPRYNRHKLKKHWYLFRNRYGILKEFTTSEGHKFQKIVGFKRTDELLERIALYVTKQKKADWLSDLPDKMYQTLHVEMSKAQQKIYDQLREELYAEYKDTLITAANAAVLLTRLRQVAGGFIDGKPIDKIPPGIETLIDDVSEYSGKVVIFAAFVAEIEYIRDTLIKEYGAELVCTYYGGTKDRDEEIHRFKESGKFLVTNPQTGAFGLNLQCASLMYWYSRPWSYEQNVQGEERIHRPGQKNTCVYKDIIYAGTVQEKVKELILKKEKTASLFDELSIKELLDN